MQPSGSMHASRDWDLSAGLAVSCTGSVGLTAANNVGGAAGCGIEGGSDKAALTPVLSTLSEPAASLAIGASVLSMPSEPRPASPVASHPARANVPHNATNTESRQFTPSPKVRPRSNADFNSVDVDCKPYRVETNRAARIITGNSALTTATTPKSNSAMTITILSPRLVPMTSLPFRQTA